MSSLSLISLKFVCMCVCVCLYIYVYIYIYIYIYIHYKDKKRQVNENKLWSVCLFGNTPQLKISVNYTQHMNTSSFLVP